MLFYAMCVIVLYCIELYLLYCPILHCSTLPPGINSFVVNNNNNNMTLGNYRKLPSWALHTYFGKC
jgi:hypothetical protein